MELGEQPSPSNSLSASSFDSCSDLLSLWEKSSQLPGLDDFAFVHRPFPLNESDDEVLVDPSPADSRMLVDAEIQSIIGALASVSQGEDRADLEGIHRIVRGTRGNRHRHRAEEAGAGTIEHKKGKRNPRMPNRRSGADFTQNRERRASSAAAEADSDLQRLEKSIKSFDLYLKGTVLPHARSMSSRYSSSDILEFKKVSTAEDAGSIPSHRRSSSYDEMENRTVLAQEKLASADLLSWLDDNDDKRKNSLTSLVQKADCLIDDYKGRMLSHEDRMLSMNSDDSSSQTTASSGSSSDWKAQTLARALINTESNDHFESCGQLPIKTQITKSSLKSLVEEKPEESVTLDKDKLGPDEIGRYLESLDMNETYLDAVGTKTINPDNHSSNFVFNLNSTTDDSEQISTFGSFLPGKHCFLSADEVPFVVNSVQVVGAKQRRGGSSMWQRMVGVKVHTVYCIKVVSGKHEWEVQRRYRDFMNFYRQLRQIFTSDDGMSSLSFPMDIEKHTHRVLGTISPTVVEARVICIEKFLLCLLQAGPPYSTATPLFWFLRPPQGVFENTGFEDHVIVHSSALQKSVDVQLGTLNIPPLKSPSILEGGKKEQRANGRTIKLVLNVHHNFSLRDLLHAQHYSCAGCYRHLPFGKGLINGFAQSFGNGKPRFCEYTGQVYCSSCHLNELAVVPAYVLWHWDFSQKRVCQVAKAYLDSIYEQPLLCVSSANRYLYQRLPCLSKVQESRTKLSRVLSCIRCSYHSRILNIMGSRRYLLEKSDFFALRDLEDLSKGAFAVLPGLLNSVLKTLMLHVTKQCQICQDSGEWCGAGILCEDPFQPIFPFNEATNVVNCSVCNAPFHEDCLAKCTACPSCPKHWVGMNPLQGSLVV